MQSPARIATLIFVVFLTACSQLSEKDLTALESPNDIVKMEAIQRIARGGSFPLNLVHRSQNKTIDSKAVSIMVSLLRKGYESEDIQAAILEALGDMGKRTRVPASLFIEMLENQNPRLRLQAVESLGKIRNSKAVPALLSLLEKEAVKYSIIWALGEIGDKGAIPILNQYLNSQDKYIRYNAKKALKKIS